MKNNGFFGTLQKIGQSLMMPVSVLPAAGLLVACGRLLQNASEAANGTITNIWVNGLGKVCFSGGLAIFEQLPVVFAIGVAIGFTGGAGVAGLAAVVGYFTMTNVTKVIGDLRHLDLAINTGVFGGIIIGLISARLYQRFHQIKLHPVLGFFSGKRFVPMVTAASALAAGLALSFLWPPIQAGINSFGVNVMNSSLGPAFYAAGKRLLIPVGLHHVYYPPFLYQFGEFALKSGQILHGESPRYFAGDPTAGRFMASEFPLMLFGLPAAALAMYLRAEPSRRKAVGGIMLSAALTSIITGITEPIEFAFIFVAPILYVFHVIAAFFSGLLTGWLDIHLGYTFSASAIDFVLGYFNQKHSLYLFALVGPLVAGVYFGVFYTAIGLLDLKTPGREKESENGNDLQPVAQSDRAKEVIAALGGAANISALDACITRLRLTVKNPALVNKPRFKELGAAGLMDAGKGNLQIIFGVESDHLKEEMRAIMSGDRSGVTSQRATSTAAAPAGATAAGRPIILRSPMVGRVMPIGEVPDSTFADKILGDGFAIEPTEGVVYAPADGKIANLFRTNHAIGMVTSDGYEVLIHIGIDTVKMGGRGFKAFVANGDTVKAGDKLMEFDLNLITKEAKSTITPVVITNMERVKGLNHLKEGSVRTGDALLEIEN